MKENYTLPLKSKRVLFLVTFFLCLSSLAQETYIDRFNTVSYSNNNGSQNFSSSWVEANDPYDWFWDEPENSGNIYVSSNRLNFRGLSSNQSIRRNVDLSAYPSTSEVTFTFDYTNNELEKNESLVVEIRANGGSWKQVGEIKGDDGNGSLIPYILLPSEITANTEIRFRRGNSWKTHWKSDPQDYIEIDNVTFTVTPRAIAIIAYDDVNSISANNGGTISGNVLKDGTADEGADITVSEVDVYPSMVGNTYNTLYGSIIIQSDGSYVYNVDETNPAVLGLKSGASIDDIVSYSITDIDNDTDYGILTITINGVDDLPIAIDNHDSITTISENTTSGNLITDDTGGGQDSIDRGLSVLVWEDRYADNENVGGTSLTIDGVGVSVSLNDPDGLGSSTNHEVDYGENGGHSGFLRLTANGNSANLKDHEVIIDFDQAVFNLGFLITDLDYSQGISWQDQVTIEGSLNGTPVNFNFVTTGGVTNIGTNIFYGTGIAIPEDATGNLNVFFNQPIDQLKISYNYGPSVTTSNPSFQIAGVSDIYWQNNSATIEIIEVDGSFSNVGVSYPGDYGSVLVQSDGSYIYTLDYSNPVVLGLLEGDTLTDTFQYTLSDGSATDEANLIITIIGTAVDSDGDGYVDNVDLDDDNDGILDVDERPCFVFSESFGTGSGSQSSNHPNVPSNSVDNIMVGTNTDAGNRTWFQSNSGADATGDSEGKYLALDNPNGASPVLIYQETITVLPNEEYSYSLFAAAAKEENGQPASAYPDVRMQIKDASGNVLKMINTGALSLSWQQFEFLFTSTTATVTFEIYNNNNSDAYNTLLLDEIFISLISCDSDNDGIPDYLDLDSDNDGCPDAIEGDENVLTSHLNPDGSINIAANGGVDDDGVPNLVNTSGAADGSNDNQAQGSNDAVITSAILTIGTDLVVTTPICPNGTASFTFTATGNDNAVVSTKWMYQLQKDISGIWTNVEAPGSLTDSVSENVIIEIVNAQVSESGIYRVLFTHPNNSCEQVSQSVSLVIDDTIVPTASNPVAITTECSVPLPDVTVVSDEADNCGVPTVAFVSDVSDGNSNPEVITRTYSVTDGVGNSINVTQTITVNDKTAPVADTATLSDITAECEVTSLTAPTATDNCVGGITGTTTTSFPITTQGTTEVTWTYNDGNGNTSTQIQKVVIKDVTAPVADTATLSDITAECEVTSLTAPTATDNCVGGITGTTTTSFPITTQGTTEVTWTYNDGNGNTSTQIQKVVIKDVTAPVINLVGLASQTIESCGSYREEGATVTDCESGLTVTIGGDTIDTTTPGVYIVTYNVTDSTGNAATEVSRIVTVEDTMIPVITLVGSNPQVLEVGSTYTEEGAMVTDCEGGLIVTIGGNMVDATTPGIYTVTYNATDTAGNVAREVTRKVIVEYTTAPVLTITIDDITDDNIINSVEAGSNITVTGTVTGDFKEEDIVTLTVNGINYTGLVDSSGNFSISVPGVELVLDIDTTVEANVSSTDGEENRGSANAEQKYFLQDTDRDGIPDVIDVDDDNDGIPDVEEGDGLVDTDRDGIPDSLDLDSDNDGINDVIEGGNGDLDTNGDGYIDVQDSGYSDTNGDGQADASVDEEEEPDTDGDTIPDYRDLDSDNDGINDVIEGGNEEFDTNGDGAINSEDTGGSDLDGDITKFGEGNGGDEGTIDSDGDTIPDYRDLDSDNDGVNDVVEGGNSDTDGDGQVDNPFDDSDGDGIADSVDDLDGFGDANNPDYNSNPTDPTDGGNGVVDGDDSDGDGIPNPVDGLDGFGDANSDDTCVKVNNLMSPNGDPANNYLHIDCIENFPRNTIEIFNRWGNTVFKMEGYSNNNQDKRFEGISNGRANINVNDKLPVGTYFYILDLGNGSKVKKGWIYINR
ncbi:gliding motility-associated-like protein [Tenacibaculum lutimaris]|uniref:Gliding motility-associated-like protein n=1 Tax=Tenacibaculum lutimaris TaxID=285258 RepID=A0A420DZU3_9FLAO|nr:gliding motility-associated C-terminal domain-containing protein [Tenacibaculum lutimaris]RKF03177.1 gliding motility-associated-like protein [Tenacibaculum lutimaris]